MTLPPDDWFSGPREQEGGDQVAVAAPPDHDDSPRAGPQARETPAAAAVDEKEVPRLVAALKRSMERLFSAWKAADAASQARSAAWEEQALAVQDVSRLRVPDPYKEEGGALRQYLQEVRKRHVRLAAARKGAVGSLDALDRELARLSGSIEELESLVLIEGLDGLPDRLHAAHLVAADLLERTRSASESMLRSASSYREKIEPDSRKKAPRLRSFKGQLRRLDESLERLIAVQSRTRTAFADANVAEELTHELEQKEFLEPQKPTAEEVGRYLKEIELWCRKYLPAQREAAEKVKSFRELHATLERDLKVATRAYNRVAALEQRQVDADVFAQVLGARELLAALGRVARSWRFFANKWATKTFDDSEPVPDVTEEEEAAMERLDLPVKNIGVAVAAKCMAHARWSELKGFIAEELPDCPSFSTVSYEADLGQAVDRVESYLARVEEVESRNQQRREEIGIAWDGYMGCKVKAKDAAAVTLKMVSTMERTLRPPISDEMRIAIHRVRKLHALHGSTYY